MNTRNLKRYPVIKNDPLQAWCSADELVVNHFENINLNGKNILVINDQFGAITSHLEYEKITFYNDSFISHQGASLNIKHNVRMINRLDDLEGEYDYVILSIPKNYSFLEDILAVISHHLKPSSQLVACAMVKHLGAKAFDIINKYIGETTTSLARKKARLIFASFEKIKVQSPYPLNIKIEGFEFPIVNYSNVFSREKLDIGTRFFLEYIPENINGNILDLACGNGIVGIKASQLNPRSHIAFSDDSMMAIQSAKMNSAHLNERKFEFVWTNCFEVKNKTGFDLVLCNPPFHQGHSIGDTVARQMFQDAKNNLNKNGKLRIIGNSHLGYQVALKRIFGNVTKIAQNNKFHIWESTK